MLIFTQEKYFIHVLQICLTFKINFAFIQTIVHWVVIPHTNRMFFKCLNLYYVFMNSNLPASTSTNSNNQSVVDDWENYVDLPFFKPVSDRINIEYLSF